jgi:hypothetical protein
MHANLYFYSESNSSGNQKGMIQAKTINMTTPIQNLIKERRLFYEVSLYYVVDEERPVGRPVSMKRIQAGFDVNLYGLGAVTPLRLDVDDARFHSMLEELEQLASEVVPEHSESTNITITPFEDSLVLDTHRDLAPAASVRIRITGARNGFDREGNAEERVLSRIRTKLDEWNVPERKGA